MESKKITLESILNDEKAPAKFVTNELSMVNRSTQALEKETLKFSKEELAQIETIKNEIDVEKLNTYKNNSFSQDNLFHTLLGLFEVETEVYKKDMDILYNASKPE